jgi:hypothetical protein
VADIVPLQIWAHKSISTAVANSLGLPQVRLVHLASAVILLDKSRASGPGASCFFLTGLYIGESFVTSGSSRQGLPLKLCVMLR